LSKTRKGDAHCFGVGEDHEERAASRWSHMAIDKQTGLKSPLLADCQSRSEVAKKLLRKLH